MKPSSLWLGLAGLGANMLALSWDIEMPKYTSYAEIQASEDLKAIQNPGNYIEAALELARHLFSGGWIRLMDDHYVSSDGVAHVYFQQLYNNRPIEDRVLNVNVKNGAIFSYGENLDRSILRPPNSTRGSANSTQKRAVNDAVAALGTVIRTNNLTVTMDDIKTEEVKTEDLGEDTPVVFKGTKGTIEDPRAEIVYTVKDGQPIPTWKVEVNTRNSALVSYVNAENTEEVFNTVDRNHNYATFEVYPWSVPNPEEGSRQIVEDPWDINASPLTWISDKTTEGNNAVVGTFVGANNTSYFPSGGSERKFEYPFSTDQTQAKDNINASITQVFYTVNKYHDLLYLLGFDEKAGNFQDNNNGKGGKDGDSLRVLVNDPYYKNNAAFHTAVDGKHPRLYFSPTFISSRFERDPTMDASVIIHEYTHGLTDRLTGGPATDFCSANHRGHDFDVRGLDEGWSDFAPLAIHLKPSDNRTKQSTQSPWARDHGLIQRLRPYSTDMTVNNLTYGMTSQMKRNNHLGTFWATTLYEVLWNLVDKHGITDREVPEFDARGVPTDGRYYTLKLIMHAMMLQPCLPTWINARNAILDADIALSGGENQCEIWRGFAKRGLGRLATYEKKTFDTPSQRSEDFSVPDECDGSTDTVPSMVTSNSTQPSTPRNATSEPSEIDYDRPAWNKADDGPARNKTDDGPAWNKADDGPARNKANDGPARNKTDDGPARNKTDDGPAKNKN